MRPHCALPFLLCIALLAAACVSQPPAARDPWVIPADRYVFIDHHVSRSGEALNGTCGGGMMIDFPMYAFDTATGNLTGMSARGIEVNKSLKIVYGDGVSLGGVLGGGASTYLTPVYALPFTRGEVRISGVTPDGLAILSSGNETIALPAGETWTNVTVTTGAGEFMGGGGTCTVKVTTKMTISNAGILEKGRIER